MSFQVLTRRTELSWLFGRRHGRRGSDIRSDPLRVIRRCMMTTDSTTKRPGLVRQSRLSRKDRRLMERKSQKQQQQGKKFEDNQRHKSTTHHPTAAAITSSPPSDSRWKRFLPQIPSIPGGYSTFQRNHVMEMAKRLPFWFVLLYLASSDDTSPFVLIPALGPSMLPTIHPIGDIYLCSTGAWSRLLQIKIQYKVGDVVLWILNSRATTLLLLSRPHRTMT